MGETTDPLRLGVKRARGCAQSFRQLVRGELDLGALDAALRSGSGCRGHGCNQCAEAALRATHVIGWDAGPPAALGLATWVERYVRDLHVDFRLRAATAVAANVRFSDMEVATARLAAIPALLATASPAERAYHFAYSAAILTDAYRIEEARAAVDRSRELYQLGSPNDPERGPARVAIADTFAEIGAPYAGVAPRYESINRALAALTEVDNEKAPRTSQALSVNLLTVIVAAWRSGVAAVNPHTVLDQIEASFDFRSRRSDLAAVYMRWLWIVVASKTEGMSQAVRNRLRHARSGLISHQRWQDLLYLELDVLWSICYCRHQPRRSHLLAQTKNVEHALLKLNREIPALETFRHSIEVNNYITREELAVLFALRGLHRIVVRDVRLD